MSPFFWIIGFIAVFVGLILIARSKPKVRIRTAKEVEHILACHRLFLWAAGVTLIFHLAALAHVIPEGPSLRFFVVWTLVAVFQAIAVYRLTKALDSPLLVLRCLLCFIPTICLINFAGILGHSKRVLHDAGMVFWIERIFGGKFSKGTAANHSTQPTPPTGG